MSENNSREPTPTETTTIITKLEPTKLEPTNMELNNQAVFSQEPLINGRSHSSVITNGRTISYNTPIEWGRQQREFNCINCKEQVVRIQ